MTAQRASRPAQRDSEALPAGWYDFAIVDVLFPDAWGGLVLRLKFTDVAWEDRFGHKMLAVHVREGRGLTVHVFSRSLAERTFRAALGLEAGAMSLVSVLNRPFITGHLSWRPGKSNGRKRPGEFVIVDEWREYSPPSEATVDSLQAESLDK